MALLFNILRNSDCNNAEFTVTHGHLEEFVLFCVRICVVLCDSIIYTEAVGEHCCFSCNSNSCYKKLYNSIFFQRRETLPHKVIIHCRLLALNYHN